MPDMLSSTEKTPWSAMRRPALLFLLAAVSVCPPVSGGNLSVPKAAQTVTARTNGMDQSRLHDNEYEMLIYRLPAGSDLARNACDQSRRCEKKSRDGYAFYAFSSSADDLNADFSKMNVERLQQYAVSATYELTQGKYFSVAFKKSGAVGEGVLFEDINFIVKPRLLNAGKVDIDVFGLFKYHMLGSGQKKLPSGRTVMFKSTISESRNFFLIAEADPKKNEPVYLAVIKQCDEIRVPSYEVQMLEKGL